MPDPVRAPTLTTARLTLVPHRPADLDAMIAMWAEPDVHALISGRAFTREETWQRLLRYIGHWHALGVGNWLVRETATGRLAGEVGFMDSRRDFVPDFAGTLEVGWALCGWAQGRGLAREALDAAFAWGDAHGIAATMCIINPANDRSIALAERLGYRFVTAGKYHDKPTNLYERVGSACSSPRS